MMFLIKLWTPIDMPFGRFKQAVYLIEFFEVVLLLKKFCLNKKHIALKTEKKLIGFISLICFLLF
jgi:hypothetical protein